MQRQWQLLAGSLSILLTLIAFSAMAAPCKYGTFEAPLPGSDPAKCIEDVSLVPWFNNMAKLMMGLIVAVGIIMVVAAGYIYMTAGGDGGKVATAKTMIVMALTGIILALASVLILNTINRKLGSDIKEPKLLLPSASP